MANHSDSASISLRGPDPKRRVRKVFLVLALIWSVGLWSPVLFFLFSLNRQPGQQFAPLAALVAEIPIVLFLVVTLRRPDQMRGAYWFLPLYFLAQALAPFVSLASSFGLSVVSFFAGIFLGSLPLLVLAAGLWYARPPALVTEPRAEVA